MQLTERALGLLGLLVIVGVTVVACGGGEPTVTPRPTATSAPATATPAPIAAPTPTGVPVTRAPTASPTSAGPTPTAAATPTAAVPSPTPRPAATALAASPTPSATGPQPRYGGTLQARFFTYPQIWDTYNAAGGFTHAIFQNVLNHLIRYKWDSISDIEGDLALSWDVSADGKTYTFKLRPGVQWQDGRPMTSADILFNFKRAGDPKYTFNRARVTPVASTEAPDPLTFKVTTNKVSASFIPNIASAFMLMYPAHVPDPAAWQAAPMGTGAHRVRGAAKDVSVTLTRSDSYFRRDEAGRALPYLDGIVYTIIQDRGLSLAALKSGRINCGCTFDRDFMTDAEDQLKKDIPGIYLGRVGGSHLFIQFNVVKPPFDSAPFRQAVAIGLDKEGLATATYGDKKIFPPAPFLVTPEAGGAWGLPKTELGSIAGFAADHKKDLAIAQQKFAQAGINPKGFSISLMTAPATSPDADGVASALSSDLGFKVQVENIASVPDVTQKRTQGNFQMNLETRGATVDDPAEWMAGYVSSAGSFNFGKYNNARLNELLSSEDAELDVAKRRAMIWEIQRIVLTDFPVVPLSAQLGVRGARPEVVGYTAGPFNHSNMRLDYVWLRQ